MVITDTLDGRLLCHGWGPFMMVVGMVLILLVLGCFVDQVSMLIAILFIPGIATWLPSIAG